MMNAARRGGDLNSRLLSDKVWAGILKKRLIFQYQTSDEIEAAWLDIVNFV